MHRHVLFPFGWRRVTTCMLVVWSLDLPYIPFVSFPGALFGHWIIRDLVPVGGQLHNFILHGGIMVDKDVYDYEGSS